MIALLGEPALFTPAYEGNSPLMPSDFERLTSAYRLFQTALLSAVKHTLESMVSPSCTLGHLCPQSEPVPRRLARCSSPVVVSCSSIWEGGRRRAYPYHTFVRREISFAGMFRSVLARYFQRAGLHRSLLSSVCDVVFQSAWPTHTAYVVWLLEIYRPGGGIF